MRAVTLTVAVLVWAAGCASTRYEEFGSPPEEPRPAPELPEAQPPVEGAATKTSCSVEAQLARLEALLIGRIDQLEMANMSLAEQVEGLRAQLALLGQGASAPAAAPSRQAVPPPRPSRSVTALYDEALAHFDERRYGPAREAFRGIISASPNGDLADNAQYWLGECEYAEGNYTAALEGFKRVFNYEMTEKDDDAQLKLGYCYLRLNDLDSALIEFRRLTLDYPNSEYLPRAEEQIRRIRAQRATAR